MTILDALITEYIQTGDLNTLLMIADILESVNDIRYRRIRFYVDSITRELEETTVLYSYREIERQLDFNFRLFKFIWLRRRYKDIPAEHVYQHELYLLNLRAMCIVERTTWNVFSDCCHSENSAFYHKHMRMDRRTVMNLFVTIKDGYEGRELM